MFVTISLCLYYFCLLSFILINSTIYYCILLVMCALSGAFVCYVIYGFSWYSVLFCLVYVGGVYILFIFVSVFNPNNLSVGNYKLKDYFLIGVLFIIMFCLGSVFIVSGASEVEFSEYICTIAEGGFYICMCMALLYGFIMISLVMSIKMNYYR